MKFKPGDILIKIPKPENASIIDKIKVLRCNKGFYLIYDYESDSKHMIFKETVELKFIKLTKLSSLFYL